MQTHFNKEYSDNNFQETDFLPFLSYVLLRQFQTSRNFYVKRSFSNTTKLGRAQETLMLGINMRFRVRLSAVEKGTPKVLYSRLTVSQICTDRVLCKTGVTAFHHSYRCLGSERQGMADPIERWLTTGTEQGKGQEQCVWTQTTKGY